MTARALLNGLAAFFVLALFPAQAKADRVEELQLHLTAEEDGSVEVMEIIRVRFSGRWQHGIYRFIPTAHPVSVGVDPISIHLARRIELRDISVTDHAGQPVMFAHEDDGVHTLLVIGNPNGRVDGTRIYVLRYNVQRGWIRHDKQQLFRWNATGPKWDIPTDELSIHIHESALAALETTAFTQNQSLAPETENGTSVFRLDGSPPAQGVIVQLSLGPEPAFAPGKAGEAFRLASDNLWFPLPFLIPFFVFLAAWCYRPPSSTNVDTSTFLPSPIDAGLLIDSEVGVPEVAALLTDLFAREVLKISKTKTDEGKVQTRVQRCEVEGENLTPFEFSLLEESGLMKDGDSMPFGHMGAVLQNYGWKIERSAMKELMAKGIAQRSQLHQIDRPQSRWAGYSLAGFFLVNLTYAFTHIFPSFAGGAWLTAMTASLVLTYFAWKQLAGRFRPWTQPGLLWKEEVAAWKPRLEEWLHTGDSNLLPANVSPRRGIAYAIALGCSDALTRMLAGGRETARFEEPRDYVDPADILGPSIHVGDFLAITAILIGAAGWFSPGGRIETGYLSDISSFDLTGPPVGGFGNSSFGVGGGASFGGGGGGTW